MLEKKKINFIIESEPETKTFSDKNGNDVVILDWIPADEKEAFARELVEYTMGTDDELGICYKMMIEDEVYTYLLIKYYTDIDVSEVQDADGFRKLYDYAERSGLKNEMDSYISSTERYTLYEMAGIYRDAIEKLYETEHSLGYAVKKFLSTDVDTNNKETRELIEKLIDMKGALMEKEEQSKVLAFGKKKPANIRTGGAKMNLAKR